MDRKFRGQFKEFGTLALFRKSYIRLFGITSSGKS